jgi:putative transcriptional regulator
MSELGNRIIEGLEEAISYAKGEDAAATEHVLEVPSVEVKAIRGKLDMTQEEFAMAFGFSLGTLRNWEQGHRRPDKSARLLLAMIDREPETVWRVLSDISKSDDEPSRPMRR